MDLELSVVESEPFIYYPDEDFWQRPVQFLETFVSAWVGPRFVCHFEWFVFVLALYTFARAFLVVFLRPVLRPLLYRYAYGEKKRR
jgi:hypothetical protein